MSPSSRGCPPKPAPYRAFFSIFLRERGLSPAAVGLLGTISVAAEILAFRCFAPVHGRLSLDRLLTITFGAAMVRSFLTARADSLVALAALQLLHALTFGIYWAAALHWLRDCVAPSVLATAQMLYTGATFGLGGVVGTLGTGFLQDLFLEARPAFVAAGLIEVLPLALMMTLGRTLVPRAVSP